MDEAPAGKGPLSAGELSWAIKNCPQDCRWHTDHGPVRHKPLRLEHHNPPTPSVGFPKEQSPTCSRAAGEPPPMPCPGSPHPPARQGSEASRLPGHAAYHTGFHSIAHPELPSLPEANRTHSSRFQKRISREQKNKGSVEKSSLPPLPDLAAVPKLCLQAL